MSLYWSIDALLADSQRLACTFNIDVPNIGHLQSSEEADIKALSRLELPFWLVEVLASYGFVSLTMPKAYGPRVRAALDANPTSVQLRSQNVYWYALGLRLGHLIHTLDPEAEASTDLLTILTKTYTGRLPQLFQQTQHLASSSTSDAVSSMLADGPALGLSAGSGMSAEMSEFLQGLDESERYRKSPPQHL